MFIKISATTSAQPLHDAVITKQYDWYHVVYRGGSASLRVRDDYPITYCTKLDSGIVQLGYGYGNSSLNDEYLRISLHTDGSLEVERDAICTLPLYYGYDGMQLIISNDFHEVCSALRMLTPNNNHMSNALHKFTDMWDTMFREVRVLGERQRLVYTDSVTIHEPQPRLWSYNAQLVPTDPAQFARVLHESFDTFYDTRLKGVQHAFEISGGLDSGLLPLYLGRKMTKPLIGYSLLMQGVMRSRQLEKLQETAQAGNIDLTTVQLDDAYDLMPALTPDAAQRFIPTLHATYVASYAAAVMQMRGRGVRVIVTGLCGDQLLEHTPTPDLYNLDEAFALRRPTFAGPQLPDVSIKLPQTLLCPNTVTENSATANTYIEHDIWPVSPFQNLSLYNFCQALPIQYRANKNIFRAYYQAAGLPHILYTGTNEEYEDYFKNILSSSVAADRVAYLSKRARTEAYRLINIESLRTFYNQIIRQSADCTRDLYSVYMWITIEQNLRLIS